MKHLAIRKWLADEIRGSLLLDGQLLLLTFVIGMQDVATFVDYSCFASNQTGNSVLLAAGVFGLGGELVNLSNIGVSLAAFVSGGFVAGQIGNVAGPRRRWWLLLSSLLQTAMVFAASALQFVFRIRSADTVSRVVITLLAFSSGGQVAMTRGLKITEITTAMATAAWVDLFVDERFWEWKNRSRNRRIGFLILLVSGSFAGAWTYRQIGSAFVLLINAVGKAIAVVILMFNGDIEKEKTEEAEDGEDGTSGRVRTATV
jgi:uncharacterized membrane protein YoaK (UPF0700 family)